jgi:hypothetical protein
MTNRWDNYSRPTGGGETAIGDGAALLGADPAVEIRAAIVAKLGGPQLGPLTAAAKLAVNAGVAVAVERESRAREVRDEALGKLEARVEDLDSRLDQQMRIADLWKEGRDALQTRIDAAEPMIEQELQLAQDGEGYEPGAVARAIVNKIRYGSEDAPSALAGDTPEATDG